jgi:hypothetical protein
MTAWPLALEWGEIGTLHEVWKCTQMIPTTEELNKILLGPDKERRTAWHLAVIRGELKKLQKNGDLLHILYI